MGPNYSEVVGVRIDDRGAVAAALVEAVRAKEDAAGDDDITGKVMIFALTLSIMVLMGYCFSWRNFEVFIASSLLNMDSEKSYNDMTKEDKKAAKERAKAKKQKSFLFMDAKLLDERRQT
ncbi:unnamed protein product [Dovyalis caffra]|uniref:Uncharacterized protein n=1 Tax=Dovyalis caffra TaxID=77055 RepID=A0AAV1SVC6_9ROSI|nr:unnamed protein product [Dovyalis caffra]